MELGFYRLYENVTIPSFATKESACFDIKAHLADNDGRGLQIKVVDVDNVPSSGPNISREWLRLTPYQFLLAPGWRALIPTGLILKIPSGHSVRLHPRSGLAFKHGLVLANSEGVIDSDYFDELMILVTNTSKQQVTINHGDKICQGELVQSLQYSLTEIHTRPTWTTDRVGGFGSTGV